MRSSLPCYWREAGRRGCRGPQLLGGQHLPLRWCGRGGGGVARGTCVALLALLATLLGGRPRSASAAAKRTQCGAAGTDGTAGSGSWVGSNNNNDVRHSLRPFQVGWACNQLRESAFNALHGSGSGPPAALPFELQLTRAWWGRERGACHYVHVCIYTFCWFCPCVALEDVFKS